MSTAYYAHLARIAADVARALGLPPDAARYDELFQKIRTDFNARFLGSDGVYREKDADPFTQTAQILPLAFGLVPDDQRAAVAARLADDIVENRDGHAYVGVIGARYVLPVLSATGHHDVAYRVATQTTEPSWGYWTDVAGFTALGEHWPADTRSRNHHFFGAIVEWLYEDLAGIRPLEPGYRTIEFKPEIPATGTDGSVGVLRQRARPDRRALEAHRYRAGARRDRAAQRHRARSCSRAEPAGRRRPIERASVRLVGVEGGRVVYEVGSGRYQFRTR